MVLGGEGDSMSPETGLSGDIAGKLNVLLMESDDGSEFSNELVVVEEEKLKEIMQELYKEITSSSFSTASQPMVTFPSPSSSSSSSPVSLSSFPFFSASDVKSDSCGASMSDSLSTVMAGIEFVGPARKFSDVKLGLPEIRNGSPENELWVMECGFDGNNSNNLTGAEEEEMEVEVEGCDAGEYDNDQWLARVLGWGPLELEGWT